MENADWEFYYSKVLNLSPEEFATMKKAFSEPLPVGVRLNPLFPVSVRSSLLKAEPKPTTLPFLPDSIQFESVDRKAVKKDEDLKALKRVLHSSEVVGAITRQEVVSMIPPLALQIPTNSHFRVLDMCAAPGSKTTQILEQISDLGLVVGNDVDWKRANMLAHQTARLCHPGVLITNGDAYFFPITPEGGYDRVLCDVPCSADGTLRKSPEIWHKWRLNDGFSLHPRQLQILLRGLALTQGHPCLLHLLAESP
jgi:16S rRNA C967 or C1407 C5-methylase (RsmB/RsmF family)